MLDYLMVFERAANRFPGFESEVQGVYRRTEADGSVKLYTLVLESKARSPLCADAGMRASLRR